MGLGDSRRRRASSLRVRRLIGRQQARRVDLGVALGRRQRGVAQQVLDGPQIRPRSQQMGGEGVAEGVRRHPVRQAQASAQGLDQTLDMDLVLRTWSWTWT